MLIGAFGAVGALGSEVAIGNLALAGVLVSVGSGVSVGEGVGVGVAVSVGGGVAVKVGVLVEGIGEGVLSGANVCVTGAAGSVFCGGDAFDCVVQAHAANTMSSADRVRLMNMLLRHTLIGPHETCACDTRRRAYLYRLDSRRIAALSA
jgi:hypothetical protein